MQCVEWEEMISQFMDGALSDADSERLKEHLETCEACKESFEEMTSMIDALHGIDEIILPADFHSSVMNLIYAEKKSSKKRDYSAWTRFAASAACVLATLLVIGGVLSGVRGLAGGKSQNATGADTAVVENSSPDVVTGEVAAAPKLYFSPQGEALESSSNALDSVMRQESLALPVDDESNKNRVSFSIYSTVESMEEALEVVNSLQGYTEWSDLSLGGAKRGTISRRVDFTHYEQAKETLRGIGATINESESVQSYAGSIIETKARLLAKEEEKARLEELLSKSSSMDVLIRVDSQLSTVISQYESYMSQLRSIENETGSAYLTIEIFEEYKPGEVSLPERAFGTRLMSGFISSFNSTAAFLEDFLVWLSGAIIPLLCLCALIAIVATSVKRIKKRRSGK
jgi:negative regulator of sigma E activity